MYDAPSVLLLLSVVVLRSTVLCSELFSGLLVACLLLACDSRPGHLIACPLGPLPLDATSPQPPPWTYGHPTTLVGVGVGVGVARRATVEWGTGEAGLGAGAA